MNATPSGQQIFAQIQVIRTSHHGPVSLTCPVLLRGLRTIPPSKCVHSIHKKLTFCPFIQEKSIVWDKKCCLLSVKARGPLN